MNRSALIHRLIISIIALAIISPPTDLKAEEAKPDPAKLEALLAENKTEARERMREDSKEYSREELTEIESLYQVANKNWRTPEAKESLEKLVKKYKKANRTGCALLYLAQYSEGQEREDYLTQVVDDFSDCYYGNGCIVGGYARYLLGIYYLETNREKEAEVIFDEIQKKFDTAISHRGELITELVARLNTVK